MLKRRNLMLMSAIGAMLSAGAAAIEHAFERIEEKFHLRHAHTEQVCTFDTAEAAHNFLANTDEADRDNWLPHDPNAPAAAPVDQVQTAEAASAPAGEPAESVAEHPDAAAPAPAPTVLSVDLDQLREELKADTAAEDAQAAAPTETTAAPAETPAAAPAGDTAAA